MKFHGLSCHRCWKKKMNSGQPRESNCESEFWGIKSILGTECQLQKHQLFRDRNQWEKKVITHPVKWVERSQRSYEIQQGDSIHRQVKFKILHQRWLQGSRNCVRSLVGPDRQWNQSLQDEVTTLKTMLSCNCYDITYSQHDTKDKWKSNRTEGL